MKKVFSFVLCGLLVFGMGVVSAQASVTINGLVDGTEWAIPKVFAVDPNEVAVTDNGHDIHYLYGLGAPSANLYVRTDMWATPSLSKESGWGNDSYVMWQFDWDGDNSVDLSAQLVKEIDYGNADGLIHYYVGSTEYTNGTVKYWGMNSIYEAMIPASHVPSFDPSLFQMRVISETASISADDNLPDRGWTKVVPEPASMAMVGLGLLGFVGGIVRKKFQV